MWRLTLTANAVVTWTTEYNGLAVTALRRTCPLLPVPGPSVASVDEQMYAQRTEPAAGGLAELQVSRPVWKAEQGPDAGQNGRRDRSLPVAR